MENVTTYFELERDATVKWLDFIETLNSSEWDLDEDYERLYSGDAWDKAGASEFWSGIIGLIGMGAVFAFNVGSDTSLIALIGFGAALCAFRIFQGFYRFKKAGAIRRSFMEKRDVLEKEPGWLWRYENFIRPELNTFPDFAQNTFDGMGFG